MNIFVAISESAVEERDVMDVTVLRRVPIGTIRAGKIAVRELLIRTLLTAEKKLSTRGKKKKKTD